MRPSDVQLPGMDTTSVIRILIIDDHPMMRISLRSLLKFDSRLDVVGEAADGLAALELVGEHHPDLVIMDASMPVLNGFDATRIITSKFPGIKVIVLTMNDDISFSAEAYQAGACRFLVKGCDRDEIFDAIVRCISRE